jgi:hypothetical protein
MRILTAIVALSILAITANAGIIGWATSESRDWQFIQKTGGIRIGLPINRDGKFVLPVEYDVSGLSSITCKPSLQNSGLAVRKIGLDRKDKYIVLQVYTQVDENTNNKGSMHYVDLSGIPTGSYEVFYAIAGDPEKRLGQIEIK